MAIPADKIVCKMVTKIDVVNSDKVAGISFSAFLGSSFTFFMAKSQMTLLIYDQIFLAVFVKN